MKGILLALTLLMSQSVFAAASRDITADTIHTTGGSSLAMPATGSNVVSDTATQTLTGKTISGASNTISNLAASVITSGQLGVANGGTGASTLTLNGMLYGNGTSAVGATAAGSQYQVFQAGASGIPTVGALNLNQAAAVTGALGVSNGGTGQSSLTLNNVILGNGTSAVQFVAPGTSGNVLTSNGTTWQSTAPSASGGVANVVASAASPQAIVAGTAIAVTGQITNGPNVVFINGSGGAVTLTATPSITACTAAGEQLQLVGGTNNVTLQDNAALAGSKVLVNGTLILGTTTPASYTASFVCDAASGNWIELSRR